MAHRLDHELGKCLKDLLTFVTSYPKLIVWCHIALSVVCIFLTARLEFNADRDSLVSSHHLYHQNFLNYKKEFSAEDELVVLVESNDPDRNRLFVDFLAQRLRSENLNIGEVIERGDLRLLGKVALLFLPQESLEKLEQNLQLAQPFLHRIASSTNIVAFFDSINSLFRSGMYDTNSAGTALLNAIPFLEGVLNTLTCVVNGVFPPITPGFAALFGGDDVAVKQSYLTLADGKIFLVIASLNAGADIPKLTARIRVLIKEIQKLIPGVNAELTGGPILELEEMNQARRDMLLASVLSFALCLTLFTLSYKELGRPLKVALCLFLGSLYTLGLTSLTIGYLNVLTITFLPILIGLGIDFGIHLVTRYEEELRKGNLPTHALSITFEKTGPGVVIGAFTTAGAFIAMCLTEFRGVKEMGIICGGGLILVLMTMITLLPLLLLKGRQNILDLRMHKPYQIREKLRPFLTPNPRIVVPIAMFCTVALIPFSLSVKFDYNLLNLQNPNLPSVKTEKKLIQVGSNSILYYAVITTNLADAAKCERIANQLPTVGKVESLATTMIGDHSCKGHSILRIRDLARSITFAPLDTTPPDPQAVTLSLWSLQGYVGNAIEMCNGQEEVVSRFEQVREIITQLRKSILQQETSTVARRLLKFYQAFMDDLKDTFALLAAQEPKNRLEIKDLPPTIKHKFIGKSGAFLIRVYPKKDIWDRPNQHEFIASLRDALDPAGKNYPVITGIPVQLYEYGSLLKKSYQYSAIYASVAIVILAWLHLRSAKLVFLSLTPALLGFIWMSGSMAIAGLSFNLANILTLPLLIGIGVTTGIQATVRMVEERHANILLLSTGKAIVVSNLTTIFGFATLILAGHTGIKSLGIVMTLGVSTIMVIALFFIPALGTRLFKEKK